MKKNEKKKKQITKKLKQKRGITLIALVVTIIVLLILAGISIQMLVGEGGILTNAKDASEKTKEANAKEMVEMIAMESLDDNGYFDVEKFKQKIEASGGKVVGETEDEIIVELDGYEAVIDAKTGKIKSFEKGGVTPVVKATQGEVVGNKVTIEIEVTNDVDTVDSVKVTNLDTGKTYEATFSGKSGTVEVDSNGKYKVEVTATTEGSQRTGQATVTVDKIEIAFTKEFGKIDVIWVDTNNKKIRKPLAPVLKGENSMKKVYWKEDGTEVKEGEAEFTESEWYSYEAGDNNIDSKNSHWANAINTTEGGDGYFVWIPRYAYRIIYYADEKCTKVAGYCDGDGIREVNGDIHNGEKAKDGIETVEYNGFKYIVHPAFEGNVKNGGWKDEENEVEDLQGLWVGKYESSTGTNSKIKIVPGEASWKSKKVDDCYTKAYNYDRNKESHLMKNSEWGAVAYLTHSQYGRNGHEITNNSVNNYTGGGPNDDYKNNNTNQSSTGNVYGIYDLSGGANEYVAAFNDTGNGLSNGSSFTNDLKSTKYATQYTSTSTTPSYDSYMPGDATYEVYLGSNHLGWFGDVSYFVDSEYPFFLRGGRTEGIIRDASMGMFYTSSHFGNNGEMNSFHVVLVDI